MVLVFTPGDSLVSTLVLERAAAIPIKSLKVTCISKAKIAPPEYAL